MAVSIIWSTENGGPALTDAQDLGTGGFGDSPSTPLTIFVRHNGDHQITNCKLYIAPFSGTYEGNQDPQSDYDSIIGGGLGELQINLESGFPESGWQDITTANDVATSLDNALSFGAISASNSPNVRFQIRFSFGDSVSGNATTYYFDLVLTYTYTS